MVSQFTKLGYPHLLLDYVDLKDGWIFRRDVPISAEKETKMLTNAFLLLESIKCDQKNERLFEISVLMNAKRFGEATFGEKPVGWSESLMAYVPRFADLSFNQPTTH